MKALVISGGGSKGAFAGGVAEYLIKDLGKQYDIFVGTSTGSLLIPLLSIGEIDKIKAVYCNVKQSDIFSVCPFDITKESDGVFKSKINYWAILRQVIQRRKTFGESKNLRKLIERTISEDDFNEIIKQRKKVIATVSNLTLNIVEYKYARDHKYQDFLDWIWLSANLVPFMSLEKKNGFEYADGGFGKVVPVQEAINIGATEIDVIILNPRHKMTRNKDAGNAFGVLTKSLNFMLQQISHDDVYISLLEGRYDDDVQINLIHTPRMLTEDSFIFDKHQMSSWWQEGYDYAKEKYPKD
jgi:predicted patatin/cPLA2 family phospholipase